MKSCHILFFTLTLLLPFIGVAQELHVLAFPRQEQLSSERVNHVIQDSEGYLWYATEGGGVCRDDGRQITIFRSDAKHPDLLGSNDVACLAEADEKHILIGTFHGAFLLNKNDYSIRRLTEVDDKRVDDIIVSRDGHWWLTSNKKIYEYADGQMLNCYPAGNKYIFRLHETPQGEMQAKEWEGGLLQLTGGQFVAVKSGSEDSINFSRTATDHQGQQLVADGWGKCYALGYTTRKPWFDGEILSKIAADSLRIAHHLSSRPTAIATDKKGILWFSTGKDIRCKMQNQEKVVLPETTDVSAMTFTEDGTLWLATIFGTVMKYREGQLATDEYASNEYGDAIVAMQTDSVGRLVIVCDRYVRLYDIHRQTLRQQNIEGYGVYRIELQETNPHERWSQPANPTLTEHIPHWVWWMLVTLLIILSASSYYIWMLHRQHKQFIKAMKQGPSPAGQPQEEQPAMIDEWLQKAMNCVEKHIGDEHYNVEQLSNDLCMSRMTLYRKIQTATGQKPTEFIRTIRLRHAAELLRQRRMSVTEISYATGFSSVSYFSRCFRAMYNVSPTQYMEYC